MREIANLVMIMGTRDDIAEVPKGQQHVIHNVHGSDRQVRLLRPGRLPQAARTRRTYPICIGWPRQGHGVFVNPALTEPFGLTLLEAGATGLPIVATNDGGPRDIIANCDNGLLIDPMDGEAIEKALLRALTEPEQWQKWSEAGIHGTRKHYSWSNHAATLPA